MKMAPCFFSFFLLCFASKAQTAFNLFATEHGQAEFATPSALGYNLDADSVNYSDCKGTPFWNDDWNPAIVVLKNGKAVNLSNARLNFYTNQLHYKLDKGPELVAKTGTVEKIVFLNSIDTTKALGAFESFGDLGRMENRSGEPFCQLLNFGKVQLVKRYAVTMDKKLDLFVGKTTTSFVSQVSYYLLRDKIFFPLKKMSKENVLSFVITNTVTNNWLAAKKNKLKTEAEIISFLDYYNEAQ